MKKIFLLILLAVNQSIHTAFGHTKSQLFLYASAFVASDYLLEKMPDQATLKFANRISNDLSRLQTQNSSTNGMVMLKTVFPSFIFNNHQAIISSAVILKKTLQTSITFFSHKFFFPTYSNMTNFFHAALDHQTFNDLETRTERIKYLALQSIPNLYFFIDGSPISFELNKGHFCYTAAVGFVTHLYLLYKEPVSELIITFLTSFSPAMKEVIEKMSEEEGKGFEEKAKIKAKNIKEQKNKFSLLLQSIKTAYCFSRITGILHRSFPNAYAFLPSGVKQFTHQSSIRSKIAWFAIKVVQDAGYVCFYRHILYPSIEYIHSWIVHPIEKRIYKDEQKRFLPYVFSGMILFFFYDKIFNIFGFLKN